MSNVEQRKTASARQDQRRYPDNEFTNPEEISDPNTRQDETKPTVGEKLKSNALYIIGGGILLIVAFFVLRRYITGVVTNQWVQLAVLVLTVAGTFWAVGRRGSLHRAQHVHEAVFYRGGTAERYFGTVESGERGDYPVVTLHKGFGFLGGLGDAYTVKEIAPKLARSQQKSIDPDDPAKVRIDPAYSSVVQGELGTVVVQHMSEFAVDQTHSEATLVAVEPETADVDALEELQQLRDAARSENEALRDKLHTERRNRREAEVRARRREDEIIDNQAKNFQQFMEPFQNSKLSNRQGGSRSQSGGQTRPSGQEFKQEVQNDDR